MSQHGNAPRLLDGVNHSIGVVILIAHGSPLQIGLNHISADIKGIAQDMHLGSQQPCINFNPRPQMGNHQFRVHRLSQLQRLRCREIAIHTVVIGNGKALETNLQGLVNQIGGAEAAIGGRCVHVKVVVTRATRRSQRLEYVPQQRLVFSRHRSCHRQRTQATGNASCHSDTPKEWRKMASPILNNF